jgi:hypothetical protein
MARVVVGCTGDLLVVQVHREKVETPQRLEDVAAEFPKSATLLARGLGFALPAAILRMVRRASMFSAKGNWVALRVISEMQVRPRRQDPDSHRRNSYGIDEEDVVTFVLGELESFIAVVGKVHPRPFMELARNPRDHFVDKLFSVVGRACIHDGPIIDEGFHRR